MTTRDPVAVLLATQNLNAVLRIMQWGVIALIFLFFLRVIRAVWVEMSPATIRKTRSERRQERRQERSAARPKPVLSGRWFVRTTEASMRKPSKMSRLRRRSAGPAPR